MLPQYLNESTSMQGGENFTTDSTVVFTQQNQNSLGPYSYQMHYSLDKETRLRLTEKFHSEKPMGQSMNSNLATRPTTSRSAKKSND